MQVPTLGYPVAALLEAMLSHRNLLSGILVKLWCLLYIHTHRNLISVILVQICCRLYIQPGTYSQVFWYRPAAQAMLQTEPSLG